ncbi:acyltransferase [Tessaracoccus sp. OS52]|uniref:acyltransferase family protein n=1 Tax=Tessaracoccus sp. OS52 TaxID=2886691 RepID=UPI001D0FA7D6|nr:acyltransferase family protein [Tessaracoccus sp. OS52]MCC2594320.1 acyltransferase [Tessaracoccus sp. OS52]
MAEGSVGTTTRTAPAPTGSTVTARRDDIQGLRAVAVLSVIAFHAGVAMPGGFVGVDVFFVISGFVITAMLLREHVSHGRVRFGRFYLRRFKRLTPALALTVVVTLIGSTLILSPFGPQEVAASTGVGAMLLVANFVTAFKSGGYFDPAADLNPLLHTWSLSIEEQFYLVFPALLAGAMALGLRRGRTRGTSGDHRRTGLFAVLLLSAISLAFLSLNTAGIDMPGAAAVMGFYSPFSRAWEFGAGAILALVPHSHWAGTRRRATAVGALGIALLGMAFFYINGTMIWPGPWTLLPVAGTMLVIVAGAGGLHNPITRLLSATPLRRIGDWSYSLYLWHWPLIVFTHFLWPDVEWAPLAAALLTFIPALLSYYFIEEPVRHARGMVGWALARAVTITVLVPVAAAAALLAGNAQHWGSKAIESYSRDVTPAHLGNEIGCDSRTPLGSQPPQCSWNLGSGGKPVYLVGDSNMDHFLEGWIAAAEASERPIVSATTNACPFLEVSIQDRRLPASQDEKCRAYVQNSLQWLEQAPQGTLVISNSENYISNPDLGLGPLASTPRIERDAKLSAWGPGLRGVIQRAQSAGHEVIVLQGIPLWLEGDSWDPATCTTIAILDGSCSSTMTVSDADSRQGPLRKISEDVTSELNAVLWDSWDELCGNGTCSTHDGAMVRYRDAKHISVPQAQKLAPAFVELLAPGTD